MEYLQNEYVILVGGLAILIIEFILGKSKSVTANSILEGILNLLKMIIGKKTKLNLEEI